MLVNKDAEITTLFDLMLSKECVYVGKAVHLLGLSR